MAQIIKLDSGSPLIGSPIVFSVTPSAHSSNYTFHRVKLKVYAGLGIPDASEGVSDTDYSEFEFATPVESATSVLFDISSALRAVADRYQYQPTPPSQYPYVKFRLDAWDEWMVDGVEYENQDVVNYPGYSSDVEYDFLYAFLGAFTDMERLRAAATGRTTNRMTRKPAVMPEVVHIGCQYVRPDNFSSGLDVTVPTDGPKSIVYSVATAGLQTLGGASVYAITAPADSYEIRFVNGLGCLESLHVTSLKKTNVDITTEQYTIARQETFGRFSRELAVKSGNHEKWTLTSGPLDEAWAAWYIHEFLTARWVWLKVDGLWVPCHVLPDETTTLINRTKSAMLEVQFTLQLDINGSPLSVLTV